MRPHLLSVLATLPLTVGGMLAPTPLLAGVVIRAESRDTSAASQVEVHLAQLEGPNLRIDQVGRSSSMVFEGENDILWQINHEFRSFAVVDRPSISSLGGFELSDASGETVNVREQASSRLPGVRRQQPQRSTGDRVAKAPTGPKAAVRVHDAEKTQTIDGHPCRRYDLLLDGKKIREIWVTDLANVELDPGVFAVLQDFGEFFEALMARMAPTMGAHENPFTLFHRVNGWPLVIRSFRRGELADEVRIRVVEEKTLATDLFRPPQDYTQTVFR